MKYQRQRSVAASDTDNFQTSALQGLILTRMAMFVDGIGFHLRVKPLFVGLGEGEDGSIDVEGSWQEPMNEKIQSQLEFEILNLAASAQEYTLILDAKPDSESEFSLLQDIVNELQQNRGQMAKFLAHLEKR